MEYRIAPIIALAAIIVAAVALFGCSAPQAASSSGSDAPALAIGGNTDASGAGEVSMESKRIVIVFENAEFSATLADTEAAREFAELLPLRLQMEELNGNEKYAYLENPLPTDSRNPETIHAGDLMLFGSSCIVLFYETFPTQYTYTPIARLDDAEDLAEVVGGGDIEARIEFE